MEEGKDERANTDSRDLTVNVCLHANPSVMWFCAVLMSLQIVLLICQCFVSLLISPLLWFLMHIINSMARRVPFIASLSVVAIISLLLTHANSTHGLGTKLESQKGAVYIPFFFFKREKSCTCKLWCAWLDLQPNPNQICEKYIFYILFLSRNEFVLLKIRHLRLICHSAMFWGAVFFFLE